jgi:hypothetical protein
MVPQNFKQMLLDAVTATLKILIFPFVFWIESIARLAEQKKSIASSSTGLNCNLLADGFTFLSYPLGIIYLIFEFFKSELYNLPFGEVVECIIFGLIYIYILPIIIWLGKLAYGAAKKIVKKLYNFVVNPHWHIAIKRLDKKEE